MSDRAATVTATGIASLAGVGRAAVSNWRRRHADFPQPVGGTATSPAFDLRAVETWLQEQGKVPEIPAEERTWRRIEAFGLPSQAGEALCLTGAFLLAEASRSEEPGAAREGERSRDQAATVPLARDLAARVDGWGSYAKDLLTGLIPRQWSSQQAELLHFARELAAKRGADDAFEYLCNRYSTAGSTSGHSATPRPVAELMLDLAGEAEVIFDFACGSGNLLRTAANRALERNAAITCYGQDISKTQARITLLRLFFISSRAGVAPGDETAPRVATGDSLLADAFPTLVADAVVASPPFGIHDWGRDRLAYDSRWAFGGLPPRTEPELAWIQHALVHVTEGGRVVLLMPPAAAKRPAGRRIRSELVRRGALQAVLALPPGSLPTTGISLHLWVLRRPRPNETAGQVLFIDSTATTQRPGPDIARVHQVATQAWSAYLEGSGRAERPGESVTVSAIDLLDDDVDLTPIRHLRSTPGTSTSAPRDLLDAAEDIRAALGALGASLPPLRTASPAEESAARVALDDLVRSGAAEIHRPSPQAALRADRHGTDHFEVEITSEDILRGRPPSGAAPQGLRDADTARVQAGDVLIPTAAPRLVARVASDQQVGAVLGRGVHVVRIDPEVLDPWFLAGAISGADSRRTAGHVASTLSGTLRIDIKRLQIPVLPIETQRRNGEAHRRLAEFETLVQQTAERSSEIARGLANGLVDGVLEPASGQGQLSPADQGAGDEPSLELGQQLGRRLGCDEIPV